MMKLKKIIVAFLFFSISGFAQNPEREYNLFTPQTPTTLNDLINLPEGIMVYDSEAGLPNQMNYNPYSFIVIYK
ncbi:MAG: hypothetical protein HC854_11385 [Flavobacterium sp.]|nr:hypothetical protein [Flavobacterium sp.]